MKIQQMSVCLLEIIPELSLWDGITAFDDAVYKLVSGFISDSMTCFMKIVTFLGSEWAITFLAVIIPILIFILRKKKYYRLGLLISANIALGAFFNQVLKLIFNRPRPELYRIVEEVGYSFPSGHSMNSMIFYGFIAYQIIKKGKHWSRIRPWSRVRHWSRYAAVVLIGLLVTLIGLSRIYLGVHYASDVLAGFLIGLGWLVAAAKISERYFLSNDERKKNDTVI